MALALSTLGVTAVITANTAPQMGMVNRYDATAAARTPTLAALSGLNPGATTVIEKYDTSANTVTISRAGTDTFDNAATSVVLSSRGRTQLQVVQISGTKYWKEMGTSSVATGGGGGTTAYADNGAIFDTNGNELLQFGVTAAAINQLKISNNAGTSGPIVAAVGDSPNLNLNLNSQGTGLVRANFIPVLTTTDIQTVTNKTMSGASNTFSNIPGNAVVANVTGSDAGTPTSLILWKGTQAQYNAIGTPDPATVYVITDAGARVTTITSSATPTINTDICDAVTITALAVAITSMTTNLTGSPDNFQRLMIRIKDNGTARAITWGASFENGSVSLPTTTVATKTLLVGLQYDSVDAKWACEATGSRP